MKGFLSEKMIWGKQKRPLPLIPECNKCNLYQSVKSPKMPYSGEGRKRVLLLAEAPGENEDDSGKQFVGNAGFELVQMLREVGVNMRKDCWLDNAVICRPMDDNGNNRKPTKKEIDCCRPHLSAVLQKLRPNVIIPMGSVALQSLIELAWKSGEVESVESWVGWKIPCIQLNTWICPTFHPSYYLRGQDPVVRKHMVSHFRRAFAITKKPWGENGKDRPDYRSKVRVLLDTDKAARDLTCMMAFGKPLAFDLETTTLKPDGPKSNIICASVSDGTTSIAFPWEGKVVEQMRKFLESKVPKVGWNIAFETRWIKAHLGIWVKNWLWDGMIASHWLNCHRGICGLDFQAFVQLGVGDYYSHLGGLMTSKGSYLPNRLTTVDREVLLEYCGLDSLYEVMIAKKQGAWK